MDAGAPGFVKCNFMPLRYYMPKQSMFAIEYMQCPSDFIIDFSVMQYLINNYFFLLGLSVASHTAEGLFGQLRDKTGIPSLQSHNTPIFLVLCSFSLGREL